MRTNRRIGLLLGIALLAGTALPAAGAKHNTLTKEEIAAGWILLYDGETLFGWRNHGGGKWKSKDGALMAESGEMGWIGTKTEFAQFALKMQYRITGNGNSGIFFRADDKSTEPWVDGYEMQINDKDENYPTGSLWDLKKAEYPDGKPVTDVDAWQDVEIRADDDHIIIKLNGAEVIHAHEHKFQRGVIGMQFHYEGMKVEFRDIKLQPLGAKSIFNGTDLEGWKVIPDRKSVFSVTSEGWLNVKNGNGDIQTVATWDDFIFQLDVISNGTHLNSGIFFRAIPGEFWQGYESQIRNQWEGDDRTKPVDFGTGGIYRRQPARKVVSSDNEWFTKTIVAHGNHLSVWVNGYQVSDFTDRRKVGPNAREHCKLDAGVISIQGHDPTTDLSFRNLKVAPLPKRK